MKGQTAALGLLTGAYIDVVQDLEVVREELDRDDEDRAPSRHCDLGHEVGEVGLHPFARLMAGALPAERPVPIRQAGSRGARKRPRIVAVRSSHDTTTRDRIVIASVVGVLLILGGVLAYVRRRLRG